MKKKIIKLLATGLVCTLMLGMTACGNEKNTEEDVSLGDIVLDNEVLTPENTENNSGNNTTENGNSVENGDTTTSNDTTKETTGNTTNDTTSDSKSGIAPVKEEEAVVYIDGVAIKLDQTYEEFCKLMEDNNWTISSAVQSPTLPNENKHTGVFFVLTNIGEFQINFMKNENDTEAVLRKIVVYPNYITSDDMDKINLCGVTLTTTHDDIKSKLELYNELPTGNKYLLDDWLYLSVWDTTAEGKSTIMVERKVYSSRVTE